MKTWFAQAEVMGAMLVESSHPGFAQLESSEEVSPALELVEDIIRRGHSREEFRPRIAADIAAQVFLSAGAIMLAAAAKRRAELSPEELRDEFLDCVLQGIVHTD